MDQVYLFRNSLRSEGINTLNPGTNNVSYSSGLNNNNLANINYHQRSIKFFNSRYINSIASSGKRLTKKELGSINQRVGGTIFSRFIHIFLE
jgi:hypothetical protein